MGLLGRNEGNMKSQEWKLHDDIMCLLKEEERAGRDNAVVQAWTKHPGSAGIMVLKF